MPKAQKNVPTKINATAMVGYEAELWRMADALRGSMDAAEYKHVVLGLIFLKYISDAFEEQHARLEAECDQGADPEDPDEYRAVNRGCTMWHLAKMNLAIRGIEGQIAQGDTFHNDRFPDLKADFILADPPFNSMRRMRPFWRKV
jgi:type I restriction-modification system DNA methylase subunit